MDDIISKDSNFDMKLYNEILSTKAKTELWTDESLPRLNVCSGKEWYRIPSSLLTKYGNIEWIRSSFDGQLPALFARHKDGGATVVTQPFNDKNKMEMSRFVDNVQTDCNYIVDLWEQDHENDGYDENNWEVVMKVPFLDRSNTPFPLRSYFIPPVIVDKVLSKISDKYKLTFSQYVILKNKQL